MKKEVRGNKDRRITDRRNPERERRINAVFDEFESFSEKRAGERRKPSSDRRSLK